MGQCVVAGCKAAGEYPITIRIESRDVDAKALLCEAHQAVLASGSAEHFSFGFQTRQDPREVESQ